MLGKPISRSTWNQAGFAAYVALFLAAWLPGASPASASGGAWLSAAPMEEARKSHTATPLPDGDVLIAGGEDAAGGRPRATLRFHPSTGTFTPAPPLSTGRVGHTATPLSNGKVLIAGGHDGSAFLASAELYDPSKDKFSPAGPMSRARRMHTATPLPNGKVVIAGGEGAEGPLSSAEIFDPATGRFSPAKPMGSARVGHAATALPGGKVLVAGGGAASALSTAELFDPARGTFSPTGPMGAPRKRFTATPLPDGKVLVAGGEGDGGPLSSAEVYDPAHGWFEATGPAGVARAGHVAVALPGGKVLLSGGNAEHAASAEMYDPAAGTFRAVSPMSGGRQEHSATLLPGGKVLAVGGTGSGPLATAEIYLPLRNYFDVDGDGKTDLALWRPSNGSWIVKPSTGANSFETRWGEQQSGDIPVPGDYDGDWKMDLAYWRPSTGVWHVKPASGAAAFTIRGSDRHDGDVPVPCDYDGDGKTDPAVWRPSTGSWLVKPSSGAPAFETRWGDPASGDIPVPGDYDGDWKADLAYWRPSTGSWHVKPSSGGTPTTTQWGTPAAEEIPVPADFDGDGRTDYALYRPANGTWYVKPASGASTSTTQWGVNASGDIPVPGDYDGDGRTDAAVWRAANGSWYVKPSSGAATTSTQWGSNQSLDKPVNRSVHQWAHLPPPQPGNLAAEGGEKSVTLTWPSVPGAVAYRLYWATQPGIAQAAGARIPSAKSPYTHAPLSAGTVYYYVLTAVGPGGQESAPTAEAQAKTAGETVVRVEAPDIAQYFDRQSSPTNFFDNSSHPLRGLTTNDGRLRFDGTQNCLLCHSATGTGKPSDECLLCHFENQPNAPPGNHRDGVLQMASLSGSGNLPASQFPIGSAADYDAFCLQCHQRGSIGLGNKTPGSANRTLIDSAAYAGGRHRANGSACIHCHDPHGSGNARLVRRNPVNRAAAAAGPARFGVFPSDNSGLNGFPPNQAVPYRARVEAGFADSADTSGYCNKACHIARLDPSWSKEKMRKRDEATGLYLLSPAKKKLSLVNGREYGTDNGSTRMHGHVNNDIITSDAMVDWFATESGSTGPSHYKYPGRNDANPAGFSNPGSPLPFFPDYADGSRDFNDGYLDLGRLKYRFTCVTCHDPHGAPSPAQNSYGGASYPDLRMRRTNPDGLCSQCHR